MKKIKKVKNFNNCKRRKEQGITLVALVVTIIILLILTGVTLNLALTDNGLFEKASDAVDKYKKAEADEEDALNVLAKKLENINTNYNDYIGAYVEGYNLEKKTCEIESEVSGANNSQTFETETEMKWQIWDYDENTKIIRLISDKPTEKKLILTGANGYNNGVWAINEVARKCYGQYEEDGKTMKEGIEVANLKRSDIQKVTNYEYTDYSHNSEDSVDKNGLGTYKFGNAKAYNSSNKYPIIWEKNDKKWKYYEPGNNNESSVKNDGTKNIEDKEGLIWEEEVDKNGTLDGTNSADTDTEFKQSMWIHEFNSETDWKNNEYYNLLFKNGNGDDFNNAYYLGCRYSYLTDSSIYFGIQNIHAGLFANKTFYHVGELVLYKSNEQITTQSNSLRPVVSINLKTSGYTLEKISDDENSKISFNLLKDKN